GERHVSAQRRRVGGRDRRVRRRDGRRIVPAGHRSRARGHRQLRRDLRGVRPRLHHGLVPHPPARAAARARRRARSGARVTGQRAIALSGRAFAPGEAARAWLARLGPALALVLVIAVFALLTAEPSRYLSPFNLRIVLSQTVIVALGAIGMTIIIVSGGIDLSVGATIALTGVVAALVVNSGWPTSLALLAAVLAGGLVGLANGLLITRLRVVPFIATLG